MNISESCAVNLPRCRGIYWVRQLPVSATWLLLLSFLCNSTAFPGRTGLWSDSQLISLAWKNAYIRYRSHRTTTNTDKGTLFVTWSTQSQYNSIEYIFYVIMTYWEKAVGKVDFYYRKNLELNYLYRSVTWICKGRWWKSYAIGK